MFLILVTAVVYGNVLLKHLQELLLAEERILALNPSLESGLPTFCIKDETFTWDATNEESTLSNINFEVEAKHHYCLQFWAKWQQNLAIV